MNDITATQAPAGEPIRIDYVPRAGLMRLMIVNFLLGLVTFSIYRFWAKTNVRRHIWACVHINGEPLEYTGKGIELFRGALVVFLVFGLPLILLVSALSLVLGPQHPSILGIQILVALIVALLWGAALYRARRYQLSRTLWRGIRGSLEGSAASYTLMYFASMLARAFTLGWSTPVMNVGLQQMMIGDMRFGDMPFRFKGRARPLYPAYALCWVMTAVLAILAIIAIGALIALTGLSPGSMLEETAANEGAVGLAVAGAVGAGLLFYFVAYPVAWSFYTARELSAFANYTSIDDARFKLDATAMSVIGLLLGNLLLSLLTFGIAYPFVQQRLVRFVCDRISVEGLVDVDRVLQSKAPIGTTGEGLADAFDVGGL
jgi:uncharacterized membrane protein YjgN (DUF898 family)